MSKEARTKASRNWNEKNLERLYITVKSGQKDTIQEFAAACNESVNSFVCRVIFEAISHGPPDNAAAGNAVTLDHADAPQASPGVGNDVMTVAAEAAAKTGETVDAFLLRAVEQAALSDERSRKLDTDPVAAWAASKDNLRRQAAALASLVQAAQKE